MQPRVPLLACFPSFLFLLFWLGLISSPALSQNQGQRIPDEYESLGGHALGMGNAGSAAAVDLSSVRSNPAMIAIEKQYSLAAGYHWPTTGRDFYQAGAVDSKTSSVAAGFTYTAAHGRYQGQRTPLKNPAAIFDAAYDSPVKFRVAGGFAQALNNVSLGVGGQYVEGFVLPQPELGQDPNAYHLLKGATLSLGAAGLLTRELRFSLSGENLANRKVKDFSPTTYRAGFAYTLLSGNLTLHADYNQRQRVQQELASDPSGLGLALNKEPTTPLKAEQLLVGSFSVRIQDVLRLLGAYGEDVGGTQRRTMSGGIAIVTPKFSLSYLLSRPYASDQLSHQAVNLSLLLAM